MVAMFKLILKGFLLVFVHLQAIERALGLDETAETLEPHIREFHAAWEERE